ncbi:helix-turn-helix transcriptional regulator [Ferruginibacter albus]|nr:helix-turn-helix transcriptional regulator [Ferruginibacter albus]
MQPILNPIEMLTKKESQVIELLKAGMLNKEIADSMNVSLHTVKNHLKSIYKKLGVRNRTEASVKVNSGYNLVEHK